MVKSIISKFFKFIIPYKSIREDIRTHISMLAKIFSSLWKQIFSKKINFKEKGIKLNIGCGNLVFPDWVNIDENPVKGAYYIDVRNGLPFDDASVIHIHCEHFLEHLEFSQAQALVKEFYRVIAPEGSLRIIVPDAEKYCLAYINQDHNFFEQLKTLGNPSIEFQTPMQVINQMFRMGHSHKFAWDFATLKMVLNQAGFITINKSSKNDVNEAYNIDGHDWWREIESLYVNISK